MWESYAINKPLIINAKDWTPEDFHIICEALGVDGPIKNVVIRENYSIEIER